MSEIKVNKISPRTACGTTTLGDSGDTFTIPAGVSITNSGTASGFGATGAASWNTTVKTSTFTAVSGEGYFVNTTGGVVTVNLPAGTPGAVVAIKDYAGTFDTNAVTVAPNGSDKIAGDNTTDATLKTEGIAVTFVFVDSTQGWLVTDSGLQDELPTAQYIVATGGTITTSGNFKIHTFTGPGTFTVCCVGNAGGSNTVDYMVVAGGGGGGGSARGFYSAGGGGAGGYRESPGTASSYTASPLGASPAAALPVTATGYPVTVGAGGGGGTGSGPGTAPGGRNDGGDGNPSTFAGSSTITSTAGGRGSRSGGAPGAASNAGGSGGSGGGVGGYSSGAVGSGNTPPTNPSQGNNGGGGDGSSRGFGGAGGGATAVGQPSDIQPTHGALGGTGATSCITGSPVARATGGPAGTPSGDAAANAADNTGNGGPGGNNQPGDANGANGGSGIVVIRYKFQ